MAAQNNTTTFTSEPPSYDNAVGGRPPPRRTAGNDTDSDSDDEDPLRDTDPEERMSMDDEYRDLPEGWVRAFDTKTMHHFYVDKKTKRSIWIHPYDDPEFLQSLPDSHPANPNSEQARAVRKASEDEMSRAQAKQQAKQQQSKEKRSFGGKIKDKLIGTKEERKAQKEREVKLLRDQQQAYIMRRKALIEQRNDPSLQRYYTSNPYSYAAPSMAFSRRGGYYGSPYGYGYGGGYGRRGYGMGMPLMGGLGGGLLLGSMMGGGMYGGGYGMGGMGDCGGGMGGGDMGGGGGGM